jgi:hypothetical protein
VNRPPRAEPPPSRNGGHEEAWVWAGLLLAAAVFVGLGMVGRAWLPAAGKPLEPPWFCSTDTLFAQVDALGAAGRSQHRIGVLTLDTLIPLTYGAALFLAARFYLDRLGAPAALRALRWLPVVAMLCDFAENACIVALLGAHPDRPVAVASALLVFSWTKWLLLASTVVGILAGWILLRLRRPSTRSRAP